MNNENALLRPQSYLVFDIETSGMADAASYLEPVSAPSNWKDSEKIAAYIDEKQREQVERAALDLDLCEVVAVGTLLPDEEAPLVDCGEHGEAARLEHVWSRVREVLRDGGIIVGFNCLGFDLPVLYRRSLYLGLRPPHITIDKYRHPQVIDLLEVLSYGRRELAKSLRFYCRRFGIPHDDLVKGSDIAGLITAGDWLSVAHHCGKDVRATRDLAIRIGAIAAQVPA